MPTPDPMDLLTFLRDRYDEDWPNEVLRVEDERTRADIKTKRAILDAYAEQVRRRDTNAEQFAAAMRRVASPFLPGPVASDIPNLRSHGWELDGRVTALEHVVRLLAQPYAGHRDYRAEWMP